MTVPVPVPDDALHWRRAVNAGGLLRAFNEAGVLDSADVHVATRLTMQAEERSEAVALAVALAVRALRFGSVCVDLRSVADDLDDGEQPELSWPDPEAWLADLRRSPLLTKHTVLHLERERLLYLDRYWREEGQVCADLVAARPLPPPVDETVLADGLDRVFHRPGSEEQRQAVRIALSQWITVLTGGPGTGKTTAIAGLLALVAERAGARQPRIALAAPTGKAAARLQEAVRAEIGHLGGPDRARLAGLQAVTLHRLLGARMDSSTRFKHHRGNRLPHDLIVVDETSMVSLTMMARLLEALRPDTRLILVGDPDQLASVEAGAVLADLVEGLGARADGQIAELTTAHRFGAQIGLLAGAIRDGDADRVLELLAGGGAHIEFVGTDGPAEQLREILVPHALRVRAAAAAGDVPGAFAAVEAHRLLCAHRDGPFGIRQWNRQVERWLSEHTGESLWSDWYLGRPVLVTANDYGLGLYNGDMGVTVFDGGALRVAIAGAERVQDFATSRLADVETMHAMTIHKSQGSQADEVTVLLPSEDSRLLTRELFYTAVTRAKSKVRVVGTEAEVRAALARRVVRATGLRQRLRDS
ncbi:exodeoxyribonuclease V subunit alpha [Mycolicibacterium sp.]|uniref:exodeoxyribonuclease V subunit alpha n=1 Tax=Mycolicibacterium sp. TaxID=2320850 RepID=UPI00355CFCD7